MPELVIFLDDGGVMNDNARREAAWERLLGEFLPPLFGGTPSAWAAANRAVMTRLWEDYFRTIAGRVDMDFLDFQRRLRLAWLRGMCEEAGVPAPPDEEACLALERRASDYVTRRVCSAFPGAAEAIRNLHARGHALHTASGEDSDELTGYLEGMAVRECFSRLYGPDLINTPKEGVLYYERIFADARVAPYAALVVDDSPRALGWAAAAGARTALVGAAPCDGFRPDLLIAALAELPRALDGWRLRPPDR